MIIKRSVSIKKNYVLMHILLTKAAVQRHNRRVSEENSFNQF
jgi:hypothetical protein